MYRNQVEGTVRRAKDALQADPVHAANFLFAYMNLERELLMNPNFRRSDYFGVNWTKVYAAIRRRRVNSIPESLYVLCRDAPKKRNLNATWPGGIRVVPTTLEGALKCLSTMRNNLAHGSKGDGESQRNDLLLRMGLELLAFIDSTNVVERLR